MFVLLTDFGSSDPYQEQLKTVIYRCCPTAIIIDLFKNLPVYDVKSAAYLIPAYVNEFPQGSIFICIVDPGVGSERLPVMLKLDGHWFVGPDNGLFEILWRRATAREIYQVVWRPDNLSFSFHGRDLFAPVACELFQQRLPEHQRMMRPKNTSDEWPAELFQIIYIDHYGNAVSGIRARAMSCQDILTVNQQQIQYAKVFSQAKDSIPFWYFNANGLVEISVNQGRAVDELSIQCGDAITVTKKVDVTE